MLLLRETALVAFLEVITIDGASTLRIHGEVAPSPHVRGRLLVPAVRAFAVIGLLEPGVRLPSSSGFSSSEPEHKGCLGVLRSSSAASFS